MKKWVQLRKKKTPLAIVHLHTQQRQNQARDTAPAAVTGVSLGAAISNQDTTPSNHPSPTLSPLNSEPLQNPTQEQNPAYSHDTTKSVTALISKSHHMFSSIQEELICSICLEEYTLPRLLHCGHSFCTACLKSIYVHGCSIRCPTCRALTQFQQPQNQQATMTAALLIDPAKKKKERVPEGFVESLPLNYAILNVMDVLRLTQPNLTAKTESDADRLAQVSKNSRPSIVSLLSGVGVSTDLEQECSKKSIMEKYGVVMCKHHPKDEVTFWCTQCDVLLCPQCLVHGTPEHDSISHPGTCSGVNTESSTEVGDVDDDLGIGGSRRVSMQSNATTTHTHHRLATLHEATLDYTTNLYNQYQTQKSRLSQLMARLVHDTAASGQSNDPQQQRRPQIAAESEIEHWRKLHHIWTEMGRTFFETKVKTLQTQLDTEKARRKSFKDLGEALKSNGESIMCAMTALLDRVGVVVDQEVDEKGKRPADLVSSPQELKMTRPLRKRDRGLVWNEGREVSKLVDGWLNDMGEWMDDREKSDLADEMENEKVMRGQVGLVEFQYMVESLLQQLPGISHDE